MGIVLNRMHDRFLQTRRKKAACSLQNYCNSCPTLKYISKVIQDPLKTKESDNQNNRYS